MKKSLFSKTFLFITCSFLSSHLLVAQSWSLTGNAGTNPPTNFLGTTDNKPIVFKTNNVQRVSISNYIYGGIDAGSSSLASYININSRDIVDSLLPFSINVNIAGQTWGNNPGNTMGRMIRLNQLNSVAGWTNFYDVGVGQDTCFFITNHSVPPSVGNGVIRKRMIVISPQDMVGINLAGDVIGGGAVPTANFHTNGTVRLENLPSGSGDILVLDKAGYVYRSSSSARMSGENRQELDELKKQLEQLKQEMELLKEMLSQKRDGAIELRHESLLQQNAPNPFNQSTIIRYQLPAGFRQASLQITDVSGKLIKTYNLSTMNSRSTTIAAGELASGTYYYTLVVDGRKTDTKKMVLTR
jgi:hypothetical protein